MSIDDRIDKLTNLPPEIRERLKARQAQSQAEMARLNERMANLFNLTDSAHGIYRTADGQMDPSSMFTIGKFQNSKRETVYVKRGSKEAYPSQDQIAGISTQIQTQQTDLMKLDPAEQSRIRKEGSAQFGAYLSNEALGQQFARLKK